MAGPSPQGKVRGRSVTMGMDASAAAGGGFDATQTVLVVDDEPDIGRVLAMTLEAYLDHVRVRVAFNAKEALDVLAKEPVGLVITDYKMPGMDGMELLQLCRKRFPSVPRILMTAYPDMDLALRALQQGDVSAFIHKPMKKENVVVAIASALHHRVVDSMRNATMMQAIDGLHKEMAALRAAKGEATAEPEDPDLAERRAEAVAAMSRWRRQAESAVAASEASGRPIRLPLDPPSTVGRTWSAAKGAWVDPPGHNRKARPERAAHD